MAIKAHLNTLLDISNDVIVPLYIKLPQMNAFVKYFDSNNKYMNLLVHDRY